MESGIVWFQTVERKMPLIMSAAPARARKTSATHRFVTSPKTAIASPQEPAAQMIASPCRWTRAAQPLVSEATSAPTDGAA